MPCRSMRASISTRPRARRRSVFSSNGASAGGGWRLAALRSSGVAARPSPLCGFRRFGGLTAVCGSAPAASTALRWRSGRTVRLSRSQSSRSSSVSRRIISRRPLRRDERDHRRGVPDAAGARAGGSARAEENVAARRPDDRRAGVLRDHQPAEMRRRHGPDRQAPAHRPRPACETYGACGRRRGCGPASAARRPRRAAPPPRLASVSRKKMKERFSRISARPSPDGPSAMLPGRPCRASSQRQDSALDREPADRRIGDGPTLPSKAMRSVRAAVAAAAAPSPARG